MSRIRGRKLRVVFPEGEDERIIAAADRLHKQDLAVPLLLGGAEQFLGFYVSTKLIDIAAYLVIIAVLILRPVGLFGKATIVRV